MIFKTNKNPAKTVLITGASSGFGKMATIKFSNCGWNVIASMRSPEKEIELQKIKNVQVAQLDVSNKESIAGCIKSGIDKFGSIDVLINNAGYGSMGPLEAASEDQIRQQMEVNFFGLINVTRAVLPQMRKQKEGIIINMSSISGLIASPYYSLYHASKYAVEGLTESMQYELNPLGIKMKLIEPGTYNTDFLGRSLLKFSVDQYPDYQENLEKYNQMMAVYGNNGADPAEVIETIYEAATDHSDKLRYLIGQDATKMINARKQMDDDSFKDFMKQLSGL